MKSRGEVLLRLEWLVNNHPENVAEIKKLRKLASKGQVEPPKDEVLTTNKVIELRKQGCTYSEIEEAYGVSRATLATTARFLGMGRRKGSRCEY